jgi:putative ABC transport system permease protein
VHEGHTASTEPEVTFALLSLKSPVAMATLPRAINSQTNMQASAPAIESARLLANFGWVALIVKAFALALIVASSLAMFAALSQALERRQTDLALLRAVGASRKKIATLVIGEALVVVAAAVLIALPLCAAAAMWLASVALPGLRIDWGYGLAVVALAAFASLLLAVIAAVPTIRTALRIDVATQLSRR